MTTEAQINANRENATKSTGPKSLSGKARSALNALKHGFRSKVLLTWQDPPSGERPAPYADFLLDLIAELQPVGVLESLCVETMALSVWRQRRVIERELRIVAMVDPAEEEPPIAPWEPWMEQIPEYVEYHEEELKRLANPGPGPSPLPFPEKLLPLLRYESHLDRQFQRAYRQLKELQSARLAREGAIPSPSPAPAVPSPSSIVSTAVPNEPDPSPVSVPSVVRAPEPPLPAFAFSPPLRALRVPSATPPNEANPFPSPVSVPSKVESPRPLVPNDPNPFPPPISVPSVPPWLQPRPPCLLDTTLSRMLHSFYFASDARAPALC